MGWKSVLLLTLVSFMIVIRSRVQLVEAARNSARIRASSLLLPPNATTFSSLVSTRAECIAFWGPNANECCTIYYSATHNCTVALTDRFQLVPNASASLEVGIDSTNFVNILLETKFIFGRIASTIFYIPVLSTYKCIAEHNTDLFSILSYHMFANFM